MLVAVPRRMVMDRSRIAFTRPVHPGAAACRRRRGGTAPPGSPQSRMEVRELDGLWLSPLLTGLDEPIVRTLAVHIQFIPGREAKVTARKDATADQADLIGQEKKGRIVDDETELALSAANRRANDLRDGSGHHGANWVAYLQVSTPDEDGLAHVSGVIEEAADAGRHHPARLVGHGAVRRARDDVAAGSRDHPTHPVPRDEDAARRLLGHPERGTVTTSPAATTATSAAELVNDAIVLPPMLGPQIHSDVPVASRHVEGHLTGGADHHPAGGGPEHRAHRVAHRRARAAGRGRHHVVVDGHA